MKTVYDEVDIMEEIKEVAELVSTLSESSDESIANSLFCVARMLYRIVDDLNEIHNSQSHSYQELSKKKGFKRSV